ncbi:helix-turn-helix domain-containing protein [Methylomonas sp. 2BW1-5-20]|uniref:helix-turn-helix domain-containing protein n=1 Tax=Methylomonas sp. 2BW1-5-20 TaxID=3376686 RepID=UPI00405319B2
MSNEYLNAAFQVRLMGSAKAVLVALADRANRAGYCSSSLEDIALRAGCSRRSAMRAVAEMEALGMVVVVRDNGRPNRYLLMVEKFSTAGDTMSPDLAGFSTSSDTASPPEVIHTGDTMSKTRDISAKTGDTSSPKPYNPNNHNARAREAGAVHSGRSPSKPGRPPERPTGQANGGSLAPPFPKSRRSGAVATRELTHVRAFLLETATPQGGES